MYLSDGNGILSFNTIIDQLHEIYSQYLTPEQKDAISQEAKKKLKNLNILALHDNYPALELIHTLRVLPASIIDVTDGDTLVSRYILALQRFTGQFPLAKKV